MGGDLSLIGMKKRWLWGAAGLLAAGLIVFALNAGRMLVIDNPQPSDVIVVLAGETYHRPTRALQLLDQGYAHRVLIDVPASVTIYEFSQVQLAEQYVRDLPEAASVEVCPIEGLSTRDESQDVKECLKHETGLRILIVTSDFHTRRSLSIFRHELREKSVAVAASYDDAQFGAHWWTHRQWAKTCLDEWLRLLWWDAVERWK
jgi:hypothetical protein